MAQLILPFHELLELATATQPLPPQVRSVTCNNDKIYVNIDPESSLPPFLRSISPRVTLTLHYRSFENGVATFEVGTSVFAVSATRLVKLLLNVLPIPKVAGIRIESPPEGAPRVHMDLNALLAQRVRGVHIEEFYLFKEEFIVLARLEGVASVTPPAPSPKPSTPPHTRETL